MNNPDPPEFRVSRDGPNGPRAQLNRPHMLLGWAAGASFRPKFEV